MSGDSPHTVAVRDESGDSPSAPPEDARDTRGASSEGGRARRGAEATRRGAATAATEIPAKSFLF